ncbi:hypothetical protein PITC_080850 [Penicillium italicum]|uniref:Uncharacterized protein n=1 Tax=Penicillium italicum TaxID=40296 RepID=A0A0A2L5Y7_PENIT|nr:hypothetical protein PITC_080850 [Penicillium italicum]
MPRQLSTSCRLCPGTRRSGNRACISIGNICEALFCPFPPFLSYTAYSHLLLGLIPRCARQSCLFHRCWV